MRITIDASAAVHARAGTGRYAQELISALLEVGAGHQYDICFNRPADASPRPPLDTLSKTVLPFADKPWRMRVAIAHLLRRSQDHLLPPGDLLHATDHVLPALRRATVFTLHDLTHHFHPETQAPLNRLYLKLMTPRFLAAATMTVTDSDATRRDTLAVYRADPSRVVAVPLGVGRWFSPQPPDVVAAVRSRYRLPTRFVLFVGTLEPRKNVASLLRALDASPDLVLVIAGRHGWFVRELLAQLARARCRPRVHLLGEVPDQDLPALYSAARVFAYPSLYEGFGLPVLEAMACGTPVVCSNTSSLPEVASDAAQFVAPLDASALARALNGLWTDDTVRAEYRERGLRRARAFTWEAAARQTLAVYTEARRRFDAESRTQTKRHR